MITRRGLPLAAALLLSTLLTSFVLVFSNSFSQPAPDLSSVPEENGFNVSGLVGIAEEKSELQNKSALFQVPALDWIVWETAASPQSLLVEGDQLWVGSHGGGLYRWHVENGYEAQFTAADGLPGHDVVALALDGSGQKLAATLDGGLAVGGGTFSNLAAPTGLRAWDVAVESDGSSFWLASLGGGVARHSGGLWTTYDSLSSTLPFDDVYAVVVDGSDRPWIGMVGYGAAVFDGNTWLTYTLPVSRAHPITPTTLFANNAVNDIAVDSSDNKWFATDGSGVVVLDSTNTNWTIYDTTNSGLPDNFVYAITIVGDERWFGTLGGGVARLDTTTNTWDVWQTGNSPLSDDDVLATAVDANGGTWFATYDSGLTYYGPLPATPYLLDGDPRRSPTYTPGHLKSYYLWLDPATYTWYLAWSGDGRPHTFTGSITADGPILSASPADLETGDTVSVLSNTLSISATETISQDIVSFVLDRSVTELSFALLIDGAYRPFNIRVGEHGLLPATAPFRLSTPQPQPPQVQIQATQTITEGDIALFAGVFTDTDSFTGHDIVWQLEDGSIVTGTLGFYRIYDDNGIFDVTLTITDVHEMVGQDSHTITVTNVPPSAFFSVEPFEPVVGEVVTFTGSVFDFSPVDTHTYLWDFGDGITDTSSLTVTHLFAAIGAYTVTLTVTDDDGGVGVEQLPIYVLQTGPTAVGDTAVTVEDTPVTVDVLANDFSPSGDPMTVISLTNPLSGMAVINLDNTVTYTPALNFNGADVFTYTISDNNGGFASAPVTITVTPVNDSPDAVSDFATTLAYTPVNVPVLNNDSDPDGDALTVITVTQPLSGTAVIQPDNTITYSPAAGFIGTDTFTYTVADTEGETDTAQVVVQVQPPDSWENGCGPDDLAVEIIGVGMGSPNLLNNPATLTISDPGSVAYILAQVVVNNYSQALPEEVILTTDLNSHSLVTPTNNAAGYSYEMILPPTSQVTAEVVGDYDGYEYTPRAFILYVFREQQGGQSNNGRLVHQYIYHSSHSETLTIPAAAFARDIVVTFAVSDVDRDDRSFIVSATAGGVTREAELVQANQGDSLALYELILPDVPGSVTEVTTSVTSPNIWGDSVYWSGVQAAAACEEVVPPATRVVDGLQALYTFQEGSGSTVADVSGVGSPLDLTIGNASAVTWLPGGGLSVDSSTVIASAVSATKLITAAQTTNELTLEAWIVPVNVNQDGPARIVTLSEDTGPRNFTLAQGLWGSHSRDLFDVRLRATATDDNGLPSLTTPSGAATVGLQHVVFTRDTAGVTRVYVNGVEVVNGTTGGDFSNWDSDFVFALANEITGERPWLGELHLVAVYNQALDLTQVRQNYLAGSGATLAAPQAEFSATPLLATAPVPATLPIHKFFTRQNHAIFHHFGYDASSISTNQNGDFIILSPIINAYKSFVHQIKETIKQFTKPETAVFAAGGISDLTRIGHRQRMKNFE